MTLGGKAKILANRLQVVVRIAQKVFSPLHLFRHDELVERHVFALTENHSQIRRGRSQLFRHFFYDDFFMKMLKHIFLCLPNQRMLLPTVFADIAAEGQAVCGCHFEKRFLCLVLVQLKLYFHCF